MPNQVLRINVDEFSQNPGKAPHENNEVHQDMIPEFLKHGLKGRAYFILGFCFFQEIPASPIIF